MHLHLQEDSAKEKEALEVLKRIPKGDFSIDENDLFGSLLKEAFGEKYEKNYQKSAFIFTEILKIYEKKLSPEMAAFISLELGRICLWNGDYKTAELHAQNVLKSGVEHLIEPAHEILARIAVAQFQFTLARSYLYKISPKSFVFSMLDCLICLKLRDLKGAEAAIKRVVMQCEKDNVALPDNPEFEVYRIFCFLLKGQSKEAVSSARRVQKECKDDPSLMLILAEIFMTAGVYDDAERAAQVVESKFPENDQVHAIYSHVSYARENFTNAKIEAEISLGRNPQNHYARTILMKLAAREGKYADAEKVGEAIIRTSPEYSLGHANLGDLYFIQGKYDLAKIEYSRTESLIDSKTKGALLRQARLKMMDDQYQDAAIVLEDMTAQTHTYYDDAMCDLLVCYEKIGEQEKRKNLLEKMNLRKVMNKRIDDMLRSVQENETRMV